MKFIHLKKYFLLLLFTYIVNIANAQFFPIMPVDAIPYNQNYLSNRSHTSVMIMDSTIYQIRNSGIETMNIYTGEINYKWKKQSYANILLPDGNGNFIYTTSGYFIYKYDTTQHDYVNIDTAPFFSGVHNMGFSPNHNIWALGSGKLGIYDGSIWQVYPFASSYSFFDMKVINDTSAYLVDNYHTIIKFHQGLLDTLYTLPSGVNYRDSDVDTLGNLWIAGTNKIVKLQGNTATLYDSTNLSSSTTQFSKIVAGKNGHVWASGNSNKLFEYNGSTWTPHQLAVYTSIDNFNIDTSGNPWVIAGQYYTNSYSYAYIYKWNGSSFNLPVSFPFMPYEDIQLISSSGVIQDNDVFNFNPIGYPVPDFTLQSYSWLSHQYPYSEGINYYSSNPTIYGTEHGVYNISGIDTNSLPSDSVNYVVTDNGSSYICTNKGLLIYNGTFYYTMDTANTPLPSNKITFAIIAQSYPYNKLYIGTDKGIAIYSNSNWTVFDSTITGENFYVTGILPPPPFSNDSTTYISTMGKGLIKYVSSSTYEFLNTSNGRFQDDSLYYVILADLGKCGADVVVGSKEHGIAYKEIWGDTTFYYFNTSTGYPFSQSRCAIGNSNTTGTIMIGTNKGIYYASPCGGIEEYKNNNTINIYPNPATNYITIKKSGNLTIKDVHIYNVLGECVLQSEIRNPKPEITMDVSILAKGVYILKSLGENGRQNTQKLIIQ